MRNTLVLACVFCMGLLSMRIDAQTYQTTFVNGSAPLTIDGDFSDWAFVQPTALDLSTPIPSRSVDISRYTGEKDLSASMKAFADVNYLYLAIDVTDDHLVFERDTFGKTWWDDTVQIHFDNGAWMDITRNIAGDVVIEGIVFVNGRGLRVPYLWEAVGVTAGLLVRDGGYQVEIQIPRAVVTDNDFKVKSILGLNVLVNDHDEAGRRDNVIGWVDREFGGSLGADGRLILGSELIFSSAGQLQAASTGFRHPNSKPVGRGSTYLPSVVSEKEDQLVVTLQGASDDNQVFVFSNLQVMNIAQLSEQFDRVLALAPQSPAAMAAGGALAFVAAQSGQFSRSMMALEQLEKRTSDAYTIKWVTNVKNGLIHGLGTLGSRIPNAQQFVGELNRLRDFAVKASDSNLQVRVLEIMAEHYVDASDLANARPYMREVIGSANNLIQIGTYDRNMRNAIQKRMVYRLKLGEDAVGTQEMIDVLARFTQPKQVLEIKDAWAVAYRRDSRFDEAITRHQELRDSAPNDYGRALATQGIGDTYFVMKHYDQAIDYHKQVLNEFIVAKSNVDVRNVLIESHTRLSMIYDRLGNTRQRLNYLEDSLGLFPLAPPETARKK